MRDHFADADAAFRSQYLHEPDPASRPDDDVLKLVLTFAVDGRRAELHDALHNLAAGELDAIHSGLRVLGEHVTQERRLRRLGAY